MGWDTLKQGPGDIQDNVVPRERFLCGSGVKRRGLNRSYESRLKHIRYLKL